MSYRKKLTEESTVDQNEWEPAPFPPMTEVVHAPSAVFLRELFVGECMENLIRDFYDPYVAAIGAVKLSVDATYKCSVNIGYYDNKRNWVRQFRSLYFIMNELGMVVHWRLMEDDTPARQEVMLKEVASRHNARVTDIYTDNCCGAGQREMIQNAFPGARVMLDLFHAIQRIVLTLSKKHQDNREACIDLVQCFREVSFNEKGKEIRKKLPTCSMPRSRTYPPTVMKNKLKTWLDKWSHNRPSPVVTAATFTECEKLQEHMDSGCLYPQYFAGTQTNECRHRILNGMLPGGKMTTQFALCFLRLFVHANNIQAAQTAFAKRKELGLSSEMLRFICPWIDSRWQCKTPAAFLDAQVESKYLHEQEPNWLCFGHGQHFGIVKSVMPELAHRPKPTEIRIPSEELGHSMPTTVELEDEFDNLLPRC